MGAGFLFMECHVGHHTMVAQNEQKGFLHFHNKAAARIQPTKKNRLPKKWKKKKKKYKELVLNSLKFVKRLIKVKLHGGSLLSFKARQSREEYTAVIREVKVRRSEAKSGQVTTEDKYQQWDCLCQVEISDER